MTAVVPQRLSEILTVACSAAVMPAPGLLHEAILSRQPRGSLVRSAVKARKDLSCEELCRGQRVGAEEIEQEHAAI